MQFTDSHPFRLFPTLVWRAELPEEVRTRVNASALNALAELRRSLPPLKAGEGWQSKQNLHERACFAEFVDSVNAVTKELLDFLKIGHQGVAITGCWLNVLALGRAHLTHSHPNNFLNGIYYVKTQAGADTVNFHDPRAQTRIIHPPVTALTADNTDQVVVKVRNGTLLLPEEADDANAQMRLHGVRLYRAGSPQVAGGRGRAALSRAWRDEG